MGRPERDLEPDVGPVAEFAADLRRLRVAAGRPTYRELADLAQYSASVLSRAASGRGLPSLPVTLAFVRACGGDVVEWERRWRRVRGELLREPDGPSLRQPRPDRRAFARRSRKQPVIFALLMVAGALVLVSSSRQGEGLLRSAWTARTQQVGDRAERLNHPESVDATTRAPVTAYGTPWWAMPCRWSCPGGEVAACRDGPAP